MNKRFWQRNASTILTIIGGILIFIARYTMTIIGKEE